MRLVRMETDAVGGDVVRLPLRRAKVWNSPSVTALQSVEVPIWTGVYWVAVTAETQGANTLLPHAHSVCAPPREVLTRRRRRSAAGLEVPIDELDDVGRGRSPVHEIADLDHGQTLGPLVVRDADRRERVHEKVVATLDIAEGRDSPNLTLHDSTLRPGRTTSTVERPVQRGRQDEPRRSTFGPSGGLFVPAAAGRHATVGFSDYGPRESSALVANTSRRSSTPMGSKP